MANFSFTVDTREMAVALGSVAPHVDGTTAAVISMQTAVVAEERRAAEDICANVNRGFFSLIRSQISQKIALCRSQADARLLELRDQALKLSSVKATMQRDFQMIAARYTALFKSLDAALLSRIAVNQIVSARPQTSVGEIDLEIRGSAESQAAIGAGVEGYLVIGSDG